MAATSIAGLTMRTALACAVLAVSAAAQTQVRLEQINHRRGAEFAPALEGRTVAVEAIVSSHPLLINNYAHLSIQDQDGQSATLEGSAQLFSALEPGDRIAVRGVVSKRAGLPVLIPGQVEVLARGPAPAPRKVTPGELQSFKRAGLLISTEGRVVERGENTAGEYLLIGEQDKPIKIFLPQSARGTGPGFKRIEAGDKVRVTGIASQYCPLPPYDRYFQVVVASDDGVALIQKRWLISPETFVLCLSALALALAFWWTRERRMAAQRRMVRTFYSVGEEMIGEDSPAGIARKLNQALQATMKLGGVNIYLYNRTAKTLDRVPASSDTGEFSVPVYPPEGTLPRGPAVAFRNQKPMAIADTRRSPFFPDGRPEGRPRSVTFIPMFAEAAMVGVLELYNSRPMDTLGQDEKALAQHLANQIAIALRLMEEKSIREQLYRSEKLAAMGRLISGVAEELRAPIENIARRSDSLVEALPGTAWTEVRSIATEAHKASEIVARLVSFTQPARAEAKRIDLNALLRSLVEFRQDQWHERGVGVRQLLCPYPVYVLGSQGQLERVFLDLLIQAEQALAEASDKTITISTGVLSRRVLVEIGYGINPPKGMEGQSLVAAPGESVTRGIIHSHGGDVRMVSSADGECRIEVELPLVATGVEAVPAEGAKRHFTCLVVEPDKAAASAVTRILTGSGCRVIPAASAEEGIELVQRLRFEAVFCAIHLPGLNWVQFSEMIRPHIGAFVLLTEGFDWELSRGMVNGDSLLLAKPVQNEELERVLGAVEARIAENRRLQVVPSVQAKRAAR